MGTVSASNLMIDQGRVSISDEPNSFVGRERELDELRQFARGMRAVTLCGAGGIGKTRLLLRLLAALADDFPDGIWFVELGDLRQPELVVSRVAAGDRGGRGAGRPADRDAGRRAAHAGACCWPWTTAST